MAKELGGMTQARLRAIDPEDVIGLVVAVKPLPAEIAVTVPVPRPVAEMAIWLPVGVRAIFVPATRSVQTVMLPVVLERAMPGPAASAVTPPPPPPPVTVIVPSGLTTRPELVSMIAGK